MKFGMMYLFSEYGEIPQSQVFKEFLEEVELADTMARHTQGAPPW